MLARLRVGGALQVRARALDGRHRQRAHALEGQLRLQLQRSAAVRALSLQCLPFGNYFKHPQFSMATMTAACYRESELNIAQMRASSFDAGRQLQELQGMHDFIMAKVSHPAKTHSTF